ncbi:MAG: HIT domain-containing protein [Candidatus Eremiobacteraeota bacterium]|nr:HIT domain-containing protein [Candidatus Eremiobacteraeota bacterium]
MNSGCIFCKIIAGEIPTREVHRSDDCVAIADANPQAPEHFLVLPVQHVKNFSQYVASTDPAIAGRLFGVAAHVGREHSKNGFRVVVNEGADGGQTVEHLHVHVLGGRHMHWPPG